MRTSAQNIKEKREKKIREIEDYILDLQEMEQNNPKTVNSLLPYWKHRLEKLKKR